MKKLLLILAITGVMVSCSATTTNEKNIESTNVEVNQKEFLGTNWKLVKYSVDGKLTEVIDNSKANLIFENDKFGGNGSVNRYFGSYTVDRENIKMGPVGSTMMMGPKEASNQEYVFVNLLDKVTSYEIVGDQLNLLEDGKVILVFTATAEIK